MAAITTQDTTDIIFMVEMFICRVAIKRTNKLTAGLTTAPKLKRSKAAINHIFLNRFNAKKHIQMVITLSKVIGKAISANQSLLELIVSKKNKYGSANIEIKASHTANLLLFVNIGMQIAPTNGMDIRYARDHVILLDMEKSIATHIAITIKQITLKIIEIPLLLSFLCCLLSILFFIIASLQFFIYFLYYSVTRT